MAKFTVCINTITTSFHKTLTNTLSLLEVITNMLLGRLQIKISIFLKLFGKKLKKIIVSQ